MRYYLSFVFIFFIFNLFSQTSNLWKTNGSSIEWNYNKEFPIPLDDNIEMSGQLMSVILHYTIDTNRLVQLKRDVIFPQHHPQVKTSDPDWFIYRAYLRKIFSDDHVIPKLYSNNREIIFNKVHRVKIDGTIRFHYDNAKGTNLSLIREIFPSVDQASYHETWTIRNVGASSVRLKSLKRKYEESTLTTEEIVSMFSSCDIAESFTIEPNGDYIFGLGIHAGSETSFAGNERIKRKDLLREWKNNLSFESPDSIINNLFSFSKIRGSESIFQSKMGLIHSPGGGRYYVGFWANDQAEYISPLFPYLGYGVGNESAMNCYRAFLKEINPEYKPIRYAFEMEGTVPAFLLDRGDAAMIAYGGSQFLLANASRQDAVELWPLIEWCLEYNNRMINEAGVVKSESDEMEGRIETGNANLSTSSLYYGALIQGAYLAEELGKKDLVLKYREQALDLRSAIENYFGDVVEGLETYKYYDGHATLRHWICLPLVVGIDDRKEGTIDALFGRLWSENGVHVEKNNSDPKVSKVFWDRGTLYALRGTFISGETEKSYKKLHQYSVKRLVQDRVPYAVEAYPEGGMAHLSAESGLYCRIVTEGMFGLEATGFNSFAITPRLPKDWDYMRLNNIRAFDNNFSIHIQRKGNKIQVEVFDKKQRKVFSKKVKPSKIKRMEVKL